MKPFVICHMVSSLDGRLHPSRYTASLNGDHDDWSETYNRWPTASVPTAGWSVAPPWRR